MNEPIRILHVVGAMGVGGTETLIMNIYRKIDKRKVQFDFLVNSDKDEFYNNEIKELGGRIYNIEKYKISNYFRYADGLKGFFVEHPEYRIVHCHLGSAAVVCSKIAKSFGIFAIVHSHATYGGLSLSQVLYRINVFPVRYIADTFFSCSYLAGRQRFGPGVMKSHRSKVIKNGIDVDKYISDEQKNNSIRKKLDIMADETVYIHIGRFTEAKNHKFLIDIFNGIYKQDNKSKLLLLGDGSLKDEIFKKVSDLGLEHAVVFVGNVKDVATYLHLADAMIFPSLWEGLGIVLIEAQATGIPCFVADSIQPEAIINENVVVLKLEDSAEKWSKMILNSSKPRIPLDVSQENIRAAGFDIAKVAIELEGFYLSNWK